MFNFQAFFFLLLQYFSSQQPGKAISDRKTAQLPWQAILIETEVYEMRRKKLSNIENVVQNNKT